MVILDNDVLMMKVVLPEDLKPFTSITGKMKKTAPSRIIMISSLLHHCAKFDIDNLNCEKKFSESQVYFCSKLANVMFALELAKKLKGTGTLYIIKSLNRPQTNSNLKIHIFSVK
jgi:NAD(P)-dependent dehydrogenase (short-subunit alcohol dehydrogenase family)